MKKPKITFVMPVRNCEAYLAESIRSILNQTVKQIELIIYDDFSKDNSIEIIKYYADKDDRIKVICNSTQMGAAYCRNQGNQIAKADIICVADAGDINHCNRGYITLQYFKKFKKMDIFSTAVDVIDVMGNHLYYEFPKLLNIKEKPIVCHPTVGYKKKLTAKVKYLELTVHSDLYEGFLLEATKRGFNHGFKNSVYVQKRSMLKEPGQRNQKIAYQYRRAIFEQFGIEIPEFLKEA